MSTQPNFEAVKQSFYNMVKSLSDTRAYIAMERLTSKKTLPGFHIREKTFYSDLNTWLDRLDIRSVYDLIEIVKGSNSLPKWIKSRRFVIDYNDKGALDLIKVDNDL